MQTRSIVKGKAQKNPFLWRFAAVLDFLRSAANLEIPLEDLYMWLGADFYKHPWQIYLSLPKNLLMPLFLMGYFPGDFQEGKRPVKAFGETAH